MPGFFEALSNYKPREKKKPMVEIQGQQMEVDLETFKLVQKHGAENFKLVDGKITRIAPKRFKKAYSVLQKANEGYILQDNDPYWPTDYGKGGYKWEDELESQT